MRRELRLWWILSPGEGMRSGLLSRVHGGEKIKYEGVDVGRVSVVCGTLSVVRPKSCRELLHSKV